MTVVDNPAPQPARDPVGLFTVERYFALVDEGLLQPDDRVELIEGVVVAAPQNSPHASGITRVTRISIQALAERAVVRTQMSLFRSRPSA